MRRHSFNDPGHADFVTFSCYRGRQLLSDDTTRFLFVKDLDAVRAKEKFALWSYVIMPEHVHVLIYPTQPYHMSAILRRIKEPFTKQVGGWPTLWVGF
jgi:putative transposase